MQFKKYCGIILSKFHMLNNAVMKLGRLHQFTKYLLLISITRLEKEN